jgi:hypothetical protein
MPKEQLTTETNITNNDLKQSQYCGLCGKKDCNCTDQQ